MDVAVDLLAGLGVDGEFGDEARRRSGVLNSGGRTVFVRDSGFEDTSTVGAATMTMERLPFNKRM